MITARDPLLLQQGHIILEILHTLLVDMTQAATLKGEAWIEEQLYLLPKDILLILLLLAPVPHPDLLLFVLVMIMRGSLPGKFISSNTLSLLLI